MQIEDSQHRGSPRVSEVVHSLSSPGSGFVHIRALVCALDVAEGMRMRIPTSANADVMKSIKCLQKMEQPHGPLWKPQGCVGLYVGSSAPRKPEFEDQPLLKKC